MEKGAKQILQIEKEIADLQKKLRELRGQKTIGNEEGFKKRFIDTRLRIVNGSSKQSLEQLMKTALDEVCNFVDSPIGFYHFVNDDQETLSLQSWSSATLKNFCKAETENRHYPISKTGIWADCVRTKKTVIHNNFKALTNKKELPPGHTEIVRELVVPVMRDNKVVAIVGVGNKAQDYSADDAEIVSYLADVAWTVINQKQTEEALKTSEEHYRTVVEHSPDGITLTDLEGNLITSNQKVLDLHRYDTLEELIADEPNVFNFIVEEQRATAYENANKVFEKGVLNNLPYLLRRKDGTTFPGELSVAVIKDKDGKPSGFVALSRDITERTENERKLKETTARLSNIFRAVNDGMWDWDLISGVVAFDPRYYEMAGYEVDEFPHHLDEFQKRVHPEDLDKVMLFIQEHLEGKTERLKVEFRFLKKDSSWMWIMGRGIIVERNENGEPLRLMGTHTDISENKNLLSDLQIEKEKAEESDRLKSAFLANMSHEIRTPMNGILGFADLLYNDELTKTQQKEYLQIIRRSGERMLNTINDIIDISKIESGQADLSLTEINLNDQLDYLHEFFLPEASKKSIRLLVHKVFNAKDSFIRTDKEKLIATISNLIKNAIKYSNKGSIEYGYEVEGDALKFYVSDTGIGISEDRQQAIFDRFVQADLSITKPYEGSGLGLTISKGFVEIMGGKIWVNSKLGEGSEFFFTIPYLSVMEMKDMEGKKGIMADDKRFGHLTVLIAEDDESAYFYLQELLKRYCKGILRANTGREAVELCRQNSDINMVLMDIKMPDMDGYEATRKIRQFNKGVPIIGQTAYAMVGDDQKVIDAGCNDYISKPIDRNEMYKVILRWA